MIVTFFDNSLTKSSSFDVDTGSKAEAGSSIKIISGFTASALAIHSLCCCPPDRSNPLSWRRSLTSSHKAACFNDDSTIPSISLDGNPLILGPNATFSKIVFGNGFGF